jgi:hypothetical protein
MDANPLPFPVPGDPVIAAFVKTLDPDEREYFEERAAIAEFEGCLSRAEAEARAYALTLAYRERRSRRKPAAGPPG